MEWREAITITGKRRWSLVHVTGRFKRTLAVIIEQADGSFLVHSSWEHYEAKSLDAAKAQAQAFARSRMGAT